MTLMDKHVVVSGGGSGVGAEIARQFKSAGAEVTILGRRSAILQEIAGEIGALALTCDVTDRASLDNALDDARDANGPVSIAIANAGAAASKPFKAMAAEDLTAMLDVNLLGVFNLWQACLEDMKVAGWGRMMAISSTAGLKGYSYVSGYCAAKHAVVGLTRALSLELAQTGITVNSICPGYVETPMLTASIANIVEKTGMSDDEAAAQLRGTNPMNRFIQVDEVAAAAIWLSSDQSRSVTGQAISINGGEI
jgi:NAD(P)-dependent dehydrogenase (short-subunit alcohol dehydrogenase family)